MTTGNAPTVRRLVKFMIYSDTVTAGGWVTPRKFGRGCNIP